jgi:hypothetical protein
MTARFPAALRRDFVAHPLARLVEAVLQRIVRFLSAALDAVLGGFGGASSRVNLLFQLIRLVAQHLQLGLGLGLDRVA